VSVAPIRNGMNLQDPSGRSIRARPDASVSDAGLQPATMFLSPYRASAGRATSRKRNDASRLTGARNRANISRKAAAANGRGPHYNRQTCGNASKTRAFALLLFVGPAGLLSGINTGRKEELRALVDRATEGANAAAHAAVTAM
jgi:hypothetical protein